MNTTLHPQSKPFNAATQSAGKTLACLFNKRLLTLFLLTALFAGRAFGQAPTITSFTPASGPVGASVTISGANFNAVAAGNIVFFGATMATVTSASATSLTVTVPIGATYQPISVLNGATALAGYSAAPFACTFTPNKGSITTADIAAKVDFTAGSNPSSVAVGDLDGDGKPDLAVVNNTGNTVSLFRNISSNGSITASSFAAKVDFATGSFPYSVAVGDLDGDGKPDLAVVNNSDNTVSVFRNISSSGSITASSFAAKVDFATGSFPYSVVIGDLDGDGKPDLAVANNSDNTVSVFRNTASSGPITAASFAAKVDFATGSNPISVAIGDLDGDGKPDLALANHSSNTISVLRNTASSGSITAASFAAKVDFATGTNPRSVAIGDLDGDGKPDLAVANLNSNTVSVFRNTASSGSITAASFAAKVDFATGNGPFSVAIGDLDGDGKPDLAVANFNRNTVSVFRNTASSGSITAASFAAKVDFATGSNPGSVAIGDLDGDGKPDLAVANNGFNTVSVLRDMPVFPPPSITSFTPATGPVGTLVTITGTNLSTPTAFTIGGQTAIAVSNDGSTIVAMVMPNAATGAISLTTAGGTAAGGSNFTITATSYPSVQQGAKLVGTGNTGAAQQGRSVFVSADGNTAIVGGYADNTNQGAAWVYTRSGGTWAQQGSKLVGTGNSGAADQGYSVSLSADGNTAIVGGYADNSQQGAAWVYTRSGGTWAQQGSKLTGTGNSGAADQGWSVSLSADGNTAIVGGYNDNSSQGAAWVYIRSGGAWTQQGSKLVGTGNTGAALQGISVSLSADGNTAMVGGYLDNSSQGAAWVYTRSGGTWAQQGAKLTGTGNTGAARQGYAVSLSADGNTAMVGGYLDNSNQGAAWVYTRSGGTWAQQGAKLTGTGNTGAANQGVSVSLSADGNTAIVGGYNDNSGQGAAWVYTRSGGTWAQQGSKLTGTGNTGAAHQGQSVSLSADGNTAMAGGYLDNSNQGAAWVYTPLFAPSTQASNVTFAGTTTTASTVSWTNGNGNSRAVFMLAGVSGSPAPVDLTAYNANAAFGAGGQIGSTGWYCVYNGTGTTVNVTGLTAGTTYQLMAVEYNGTGSNVAYLTTAGTGNPAGVTTVTPPPTITSFTPASGPVGTLVTITGTNFNATAANNIVFFGATMATVTAASATSLTVTVPTGATYRPISVLNGATALAGYSAAPFAYTFTPNKGSITTTDIAPKVDFATGAAPYSVAVGDLDGDGKPDLAVVNNSDNTVSVFRNISSSGSITAASFAAKVDFATGSAPRSVAIGDLDGDGKPDLAVANFGGNTVSVLRNTSSSGAITAASFAAKVDFATGNSPISVAIGDLDSDGKPDLAVVNYGGNTVSLLRNTSASGPITAASFAAKVDFATGGIPYSVAIGDLDGDGKPDLAVANEGSNTVSVFRSTASSGSITAASFAAKVDFATGINPISVAIGDLDGDGKPDLALANYSGNTISVLRNTASSGSITAASFAANVDFATGSNPYSVAIGDLDGDGKPDLALANYGSSTVSVLRNTASNGSITAASFAANVDFATGSGPISVAIGDLDGDGKPDLALANLGSSMVSVLRNSPLLAPTTQAANALFTSTTTTATTASWTNGNGASRAVFMLAGSSGSPAPVDLTAYNASAAFGTGDQIGSTGWYCVYNGTGSTVDVTGLTAGTTYQLMAVEYNGLGSSAAYLTTAGTGNPAGITTIGIPTITSFTPASGPVGTSVTITGTNFNATAANDIVFFGATMATVTAASATSLTVTVPTGATYRPISVLNGATALAGYSAAPFACTFTPNKGSITTADIAANVDFATGATPVSVAIGDLDGDGKPDLAVVNQSSNTVSIFRNISSSGPITAASFAAKVDFVTGNEPESVAIGDFDGDGKPDLAVVNYGSSTVSVFRNISSSGSITASSFATKVDFATGSLPSSVAIGDLDGDGKPDLAVANYSSNTISVLRNTASSGSITAASFAVRVDFATGSNPISVAIGDLDGDGKPDLALANLGSSAVSVLRNTASSGSITTASFAAKVDFATGSVPYSVAIGDLDGDGKPDLAVANEGSNTVSVFRNTASSGPITAASFAAKVDFATGINPISVAIGDLDGDGKPGLAVANFGSSTVSVFRNAASSGSITAASFAAKVDFATGSNPYSVAIGDLDGDGKPDLAVANLTSSTVSVLRNSPLLAPTTQATNVLFTSTTTTTTAASWTNGNGASRAVFMLAGPSGSPAPVDLTAYNTNAAFGGGGQIGSSGWYCVYNGTGSTVNITGLTAGTNYQVMAVEYNGTGSNVAYLTIAGTDNPAGVTASKASETITFAALAGKTYGDADFTVSAGSDNSNVAITWNSRDPSVATIDNTSGLVHIVGAGSTNITASQAGDASHTAATDVIQLLTVNQASETITFAALAAKTYGDADFTVSAGSDNSNVAITWNSSDPSVATIDNTSGLVHIVGAGSTNITASQAGDASHTAATDVIQLLTVNQASETITFAALAAKTYGDADFTVSAGSDNSNVAITWNSNDPSVATIDNTSGLVHIVGAGTTNITASQLGDANHTAAIDVIQLITVNQASETITFAALTSKTYGDADFTVSANSDNSNVAITWNSSDPSVATIDNTSGLVHIAGAGTTNITASQLGDANHTAATNVIQLLTVNQALLTITADDKSFVHFQPVPALTASYAGFVNNDGPETLTTPPFISTAATATSPVGTYAITASNAANANYAISYVAGTMHITPAGISTLSNLTINHNALLSPAFASNVTDYTSSVPYSTSEISITPACDTTATIEVNNIAAGSGRASQKYPLSVGANTLTTVVTADDGTTATYTVTVTRAASPNAYLSNLRLNGQAISPAFLYTSTSYTAHLPHITASVKVTPTSADAAATITVNNVAASSHTASGAIALNVGDNTINVTVTAADGISTKTYTIIVTRAAAPADLNLSNLRINGQTMSPAFAYNTTAYTASVSNATSSVKVIPTAHDAAATVTVNNVPFSKSIPPAPVALTVGDNIIKIIVTGSDGISTKTYTIIVRRAASGPIALPYTAASVAKPWNTAGPDTEDIVVRPAVSPNGDGVNDHLIIEGITSYPDNKLMIINRNGNLIYEAVGYDNHSKFFDGHSNKTGAKQLPGTYFYSLDYRVKGVNRHKTGYIILKY